MICVAYTAPGGNYPPYVNATLDKDEVVITVREAPTFIETATFVCSYNGDPGTCRPGGPNCNNYCNMAPEKGPMAAHPLPNPYLRCGETKSMRMPREAFEQFIYDAHRMREAAR